MEEVIKEKYIYVYKNKNKIKNFLYNFEKADVKTYYGIIEDFDFEHQTNNYKELMKSFEPFDINFTIIYYSKFNNSVKQIRTTFLVKTDNENVCWYKYESMAPGGSNNFLFIKGKKHNLTQWFTYSFEKRKELLES